LRWRQPADLLPTMAVRSAEPSPATPHGDIVVRTIAMPADTNAKGDVFGGWLVSQMDLGGAVLAHGIARSRVVTVAIDAMSFVAPVRVGDTVTCYARLVDIGRTSLKIMLEAWSQHFSGEAQQCVTRGLFTYVAIDEHGKPQRVRREDNEPGLHV
jgi:acyl-CoA thioesterase YciA